MKFLYFLLATVVIVLVAVETKSIVKLPTVRIHVNTSGVVFACVDGEDIILY